MLAFILEKNTLRHLILLIVCTCGAFSYLFAIMFMKKHSHLDIKYCARVTRMAKTSLTLS